MPVQPALFGHPLAYVRHERGWSAARLFAEVSRAARSACGVWLGELDRGRVHRWEARGAVPEVLVQRALAHVLGIPEAALAARPWPRWLPAYGPPPALASGSASFAPALTGAADRRGYLAATGPELVSAARSWADAPPAAVPSVVRGPLRAGPEALGGLGRGARLLRRLAGQLSPDLAGELAWAQLRLATELLASAGYTAGQGRALLAAVAELAHHAGWAAHECGRHFAAQRYFWAGAQAARLLGDRPLGAYLLLSAGHQAVRAGEADAARRMSEHAARTGWRDASPAGRSLLAGHLGLIQLAAGHDPARVHAAAHAARPPASWRGGRPPGWALVPARPPEAWLTWCAGESAAWPPGRRVVLLDEGRRAAPLAGRRWPDVLAGAPGERTHLVLHRLAMQFAAAPGVREAARRVEPHLRSA